MKYTYYSSIRSGKHLMRSLFWLNGRSTCTMSASKPLWASLSEPIGKLYKLQWYWCDKENKLQTHSHFLDITDKLLSKHYYEEWFPIKDYRGYNCLHYDQMVIHENFWGCLDSIMEKDIITNPFCLFGYTGKDAHKLLLEMQNGDPPLKPHPDILEHLRKRKGIVAYKEDIEHLAYNMFSHAGYGMDSIIPEEKTSKAINQIRNFQKYMPVFLDKYNIPYEMFSLDRGDYAKTFELNKVLPRESSDEMWINDQGQNVKKQVSNYMKNYT